MGFAKKHLELSCFGYVFLFEWKWLLKYKPSLQVRYLVAVTGMSVQVQWWTETNFFFLILG